MEWNIVKRSLGPVFLETLQEPIPCFRAGDQYVIQVIVAGAAFWNAWPDQEASILEALQIIGVEFIYFAPPCGDGVHLFQLGKKKRTD
jgi:hypothetical protein